MLSVPFNNYRSGKCNYFEKILMRFSLFGGTRVGFYAFPFKQKELKAMKAGFSLVFIVVFLQT